MSKLKIKSTKQINFDLHLLVENSTLICQIIAPIEDTGIASKDKNIKGNIHGCKAVPFDGDMEQQPPVILITPTVLTNILNDTYPNAEYVGRFFQITNNGKGDGNYNKVTVVELEVTEE